MHDGAHSYEHDTFVVDMDDIDDQPEIALPRVATEDLTMQVFLLGEWHRKIADLSETACEVPFRLSSERTRREQLTNAEGPLCPACFTPRERGRATENDQRAKDEAERQRQRDDIDTRFRALPRPKRPSEGDI
jgi:hypothetical protein